MPHFLQSSKKLYTVTSLVCYSPLGSEGANLAPRQGLECAVPTQHPGFCWWDIGGGWQVWVEVGRG